LYNAGEKNAILPGTLTSLAVSAENEKPRYFLEGPVNAAGSALLWLKTQGIAFADEELNDWCYSAQSPVWFLPALGGLGAPYWNFSVSPVFGGLSPLTRREDWVAGVVRSVAYLLADIGHYLQANGFVLNGPLKASGGLSRLAYLVQFQADIMQKEILLEKDTQASVLGAARKTMEFLGWDSSSWKEESATIVKPALPSAEAMELYGKWQAFLGWAVKKPL
jgi:glycerol kinase